MAMIRITNRLWISEDELSFTATRSGGPGGQNVNKVSTRVMLRFDVAASPSLSEGQKRRILDRLSTRVSKDGVLRVVAQQTRSQAENRAIALERFIELIQTALKRTATRKKTTIPKKSKQKRRDEKKRRSQLKKTRSTVMSGDE